MPDTRSTSSAPLPDARLSDMASREPPLAPTFTVDELHRLAMPLGPDEKLRLVARLWKSLPSEHRTALLTLQHEERGGHDRAALLALPQPIAPVWPKIYRVLFDPTNVSELYSAPRRFDLATIFVVTAAFSLLLGALSALDAAPVVKVVACGLVAIVATTQALFSPIANPRGVSIVTGAVAYTIISGIAWFSLRGILPISFFFVTFVNGTVGGSILGYLVGTVVGGVFLVADKLRTKFEGGAKASADEPDALAETGPDGSRP